MNVRTFSRKEIEELVDAKDTVELASSPFKHDISILTYVAKVEDEYWKFSFEQSYNEGWQIYGDVEAVKVKLQEKTIIEWVEV